MIKIDGLKLSIHLATYRIKNTINVYNPSSEDGIVTYKPIDSKRYSWVTIQNNERISCCVFNPNTGAWKQR